MRISSTRSEGSSRGARTTTGPIRGFCAVHDAALLCATAAEAFAARGLDERSVRRRWKPPEIVTGRRRTNGRQVSHISATVRDGSMPLFVQEQTSFEFNS